MFDRITNTLTTPQKYYLNNVKTNSNSSNISMQKAQQQDLNFKQKSIIVGCSALAMTPILGFLAHKSGFSLNPVKIFKTNIKDWALFKYKPIDKAIKYKEGAIISLAASSIAGGFVGGAIVDKQNIKAKKREALNQFLGDIIVPVICVGTSARIYKKYSHKLMKLMPKITDNSKLAKYIKPKVFNLVSENIPSGITTIVSLVGGIMAGNKVSNYINEKLYNIKVDRNVRATDFAPHVDDLCLATSLVNEDSVFGSAIGRPIPFALIIQGYETGTAR